MPLHWFRTPTPSSPSTRRQNKPRASFRTHKGSKKIKLEQPSAPAQTSTQSANNSSRFSLPYRKDCAPHARYPLLTRHHKGVRYELRSGAWFRFNCPGGRPVRAGLRMIGPRWPDWLAQLSGMKGDVKLAYLGSEFLDRPFDHGVPDDFADRQRAHRCGGHIEFGQPTCQLLR